MPNTSVPAAAEGVPTEIVTQNRIWELAREISALLDRVPGQDPVTIHAASKPMPRHITMGRERADVDSLLLAGVDQLGFARSALELTAYALDSMGNDEGINAIQYGVSRTQRELSEALEKIERGRQRLM